LRTRALLDQVSTAAFSEIAVSWYPRETEASFVAQLLRLSRLTVLYGEAGAGKTALLKNGVLPRLRRRASDRDFTVAPESPNELPFPDRRQICTPAERAPEVAIFFDEWNEAPLAALEARMRGALPARRRRTADPAASMAKSLGAWHKESGARFLIIFDAFDEYLAAPGDAPGIRIFEAQFVEVLKDDRLPANFLLTLRDERPLLERFEGRIARLGDTLVRLPSWHRSVGSLHENDPTLGDGASPVLKAVPKAELQSVRATAEVGESPSPALEVIAESNSQSDPVAVAFELLQSPLSEVADSRSPVGRLPTLDSPAPHGPGAQHWWANIVRLHWRVKLAWLALPLIGISLLLIVLATPKLPSEVMNVRTNPEPPSDVPRAPAATERSAAAKTAGAVPEIARLMARANALLAQGDIASARIVLERAVDMGSAKAAFALAETYDPMVLAAWRTFGTLGDVARAKQLYAKAKAGGVQEAQDRLNGLRE